MTYISHTSGVMIRPTPWDTNALGFSTFEIILPDDKTNQVRNITNELSRITEAKEKSLFYCRIDSNSQLNKKILTSTGFYNCETQLHLYKGRIDTFNAPKEIGNRRLQIQMGSINDYDEVTRESASVFKYSRFHEDPFIDVCDANNRMNIWANDLQQRNTPLLVSRNKSGNLDAFLYYKNISNTHTELILGGSLPGKGMLTPFFWASFLEHFKANGVKSITTKISASNLVIANIYLLFGFSVKNSYFDYHKISTCI